MFGFRERGDLVVVERAVGEVELEELGKRAGRHDRSKRRHGTRTELRIEGRERPACSRERFDPVVLQHDVGRTTAKLERAQRREAEARQLVDVGGRQRPQFAFERAGEREPLQRRGVPELTELLDSLGACPFERELFDRGPITREQGAGDPF